MDAGEFQREVARRACAYDQRCSAVRGALYTSEAECLEQRAWGDSLCILFSPLAMRCSDVVTQGATLAPPAQVQACLDAVSAAPCDNQEGAYLACVGQMVRRGTAAADGAACGVDNTSYTQCGPSSYCDGDGTLMCSVCRPLVALNGNCNQDSECATGFCALGVCAQRNAPLLGDACTPQCANGVCGCAAGGNCTPDGNGGFVCTASPGLGQACDGPCQYPGVCMDGPNGLRCVARKEDGSSCTRAADPTQPPCKHHCLFANADDATGVCGQRATPLQDGDSCINGTFCGGTLYPERTPTRCDCHARLPDGAACDGTVPCTTACLPTGVCGTPPRSMLGDSCEERTYCDEGDCRLGAQGLLTCVAHQCPTVVTCGAAPTNTSIATAVPWVPNTVVNIETCLQSGDELYWTLPPVAQDSALVFKLEGRALNSNTGTLVVELGNNNQGAFEPRYGFSQFSITVAPVFAGALDAPLVRMRMDPATATPVALRGYIDVVTAAENTCPSPPTNTTMATAIPVGLGQQVPGRFCSSNTQTQYQWKVAGPFAAGDLVELDATVPSTVTNGLYLWPMAAHTNGTFGDPANCHFPRDPGATRCVLRVEQPATDVYVFAVGNPSFNQDYTFTFTLSRTTNAGWACTPEPTNFTPATALPLTLNMDTNGTLCGSDVTNTRTYWRLPGDFARLDALDVRVGGLPNSPGATTVLVETPNGDLIGPYAVCQLSDPCPFQVPLRSSAVVVAMQAYDPTLDEPFTLGIYAGATFPMACANPPTNQSPALALPITLDTPVNGRACGNNFDRQFLWRLAGPLNGNIQLDVTFPDGAAAENVDFALAWPDSNGDIYPLMLCSAGAGMAEQCTVGVPVDLPELYVMTQNVWSLTEEDFTLRVTSVP